MVERHIHWHLESLRKSHLTLASAVSFDFSRMTGARGKYFCNSQFRFQPNISCKTQTVSLIMRRIWSLYFWPRKMILISSFSSLSFTDFLALIPEFDLCVSFPLWFLWTCFFKFLSSISDLSVCWHQ